MKWNNPQVGDKRIIKRFLLFPLSIKDQTRWLEFATIKQTYGELLMWYDIEFIDDKDSL